MQISTSASPPLPLRLGNGFFVNLILRKNVFASEFRVLGLKSILVAISGQHQIRHLFLEYISEDNILESSTLAIVELQGKHKGENIAPIVVRIIEE
jgi:hypothetical protein